MIKSTVNDFPVTDLKLGQPLSVSWIVVLDDRVYRLLTWKETTFLSLVN
jgi:hypothetical protein